MPDAPPDLKPKNKKVKINRKSAFPYLDMELYWINDELKFRVHLKKGQLLKYLNKGSAHTNACLKAIPSGVLRRLASLTSLLPDNANVTMDLLYPDHIAALRKAKLISKNFKFKTLKEQIELNKSQQSNQPHQQTSPNPPQQLSTCARRKNEILPELDGLHRIQHNLGDPHPQTPRKA